MCVCVCEFNLKTVMYADHLSELHCFELLQSNENKFSSQFNQKHTIPSFIFSWTKYRVSFSLQTRCISIHNAHTIFILWKTGSMWLLNDFYRWDYHGIIYLFIVAAQRACSTTWFSSALRIHTTQWYISHEHTCCCKQHTTKTIQFIRNALAVKLLDMENSVFTIYSEHNHIHIYHE